MKSKTARNDFVAGRSVGILARPANQQLREEGGKDMPAYKDTGTGKWYCKFNYKDWMGEKKTKFKRGFTTKKEALAWEREFLLTEQADMNMEMAPFVEIYFRDKKERLKERSIISKK